MIGNDYYTIKALSPSKSEIRIDGPIGDSFFQESTTAKQFVTDLGKMKSSEIDLFINSPGGSVMDATAIANALERHPATINVIVDGWALSAASLIAMSGDTVRIGNQSLMMIHNPATFAEGDANSLRKTADVLDKVKGGMVGAYDKRLKTGPAAVAAIMDAETWYTAEEAVLAGLADSVVNHSVAPSMAPEKIKNRFSNIPAAFAAHFKPREESNMAEVIPSQSASQEPIPVPAPSITTTHEPVATVAASTPTRSDAEISAIVAKAVEAAQKAERERIASIRAAFAPWVSKGYGLAALQAECEDAGYPMTTVNAKLLAAIGATATPLASPTQGQAMPEDPYSAALTAFKATHPKMNAAQAESAFLKENPKLYTAYLAQKKGA